jgi:hypothetical protein
MPSDVNFPPGGIDPSDAVKFAIMCEIAAHLGVIDPEWVPKEGLSGGAGRSRRSFGARNFPKMTQRFLEAIPLTSTGFAAYHQVPIEDHLAELGRPEPGLTKQQQEAIIEVHLTFSNEGFRRRVAARAERYAELIERHNQKMRSDLE